jgi:hypothetical protein
MCLRVSVLLSAYAKDNGMFGQPKSVRSSAAPFVARAPPLKSAGAAGAL